jgi:hypothetical protein
VVVEVLVYPLQTLSKQENHSFVDADETLIIKIFFLLQTLGMKKQKELYVYYEAVAYVYVVLSRLLVLEPCGRRGGIWIATLTRRPQP